MPRTAKGIRRNRKHKPGVPAKFEPGWLAKMDGRTELAKQLRQSYDAVVDDLGGPTEIGHVKHSLVERFVFLEAVLLGIEGQLAAARTATDEKEARKTEAELIGRWVQAVNSLQGLAKVLGVERKQQAQPWLAVTGEPASDEPAAPAQQYEEAKQ
jgi:hypothetical protein